MRILALTNLYPNPWQPERASFNRQLFRALGARHSLEVIAPIAWTDELAARWKGSGSLPKNRRVHADGITIDHPRYVYPPRMLRRWYGHFYRRSVRRCFDRILDDLQPEIVYGSWAYPDGWAAVSLGHRAGLPVAIKVHGSDIHLLDMHPARKQPTRAALCSADGVIAPSKDLARRVVELGVDPERIHVVYNGVDTGMFHPGERSEARQRLGLPPDEPMVLFVGNLVLVKGVDVLIGACEHMARGMVQFTCRLIGQGPLMSMLERQIRERGLAGKVKLSGSMPHDRIPDWYRAADVLVLPSRSEGVPNVLLEAAACGTRFVASDVGGIPEISHLGNGRLVPPGDVPRLAQAIRDALTAPVSQSGAPPIPPRSFDDSALELAAVLDRIVQAHRRTNPARADRARIVPVQQ